MKYREIVDGIFLDRPNRFIAHVDVNGTVETVHVKNTGRCRELLLPGAAVRLEVSDNPKRKTKYDLVAVHKQELGWVNMDSQAPNKVVGEWLSKQGFDLVRPEFPYGKSRIDFYMEKAEQKYLLEVKGCTLEVDGIGYFPDAPTERGVKHLHELAQAPPHRKGQHSLLFGVVVPVALDFGKMLSGNVGLLVHGGILQPPLINEPQQPGGEALAEVVHQVFQTAGCHGGDDWCRCPAKGSGSPG